MKQLFIFLLFPKIVYSFSLPNPKQHKIDQRIFKVLKPATLNHVMVPIVGMVDTFWVSKKGSINDLAAVGAADQIFFVFFSFLSFLPILLTPKISELHVQRDKKELSNIINISLFLSGLLSSVTFLLFFKTQFIVNYFVDPTSLFYVKTISFLKYRSIGIPFCLLNNVIFSIMRGMFDFKLAIKINGISQVINLILDPFFIDKYGVNGAAYATVFSEWFCTIGYSVMLYKKRIIQPVFYNIFKTIGSFLRLGATIQVRFIFLQFLHISITKQIMSFDSYGHAFASHVIIHKFMNIANIVFKGLSSTSSTLIPRDFLYDNDIETRKRIFYWMNVVGIVQLICILNLSKMIQYMTNTPEVIQMIRSLLLITGIYQYLDGNHSVLEGILQGYQKFTLPSVISFIMYIPMFAIVRQTKSLYDIWLYTVGFMVIKNGIYYKIMKQSKVKVN